MLAELARGRLWAVRNVREHRTVRMERCGVVLNGFVDEADYFDTESHASDLASYLGDQFTVVELI